MTDAAEAAIDAFFFEKPQTSLERERQAFIDRAAIAIFAGADLKVMDIYANVEERAAYAISDAALLWEARQSDI